MKEKEVQGSDEVAIGAQTNSKNHREKLSSIVGLIRTDFVWDVLDAVSGGMEMLEDAVYSPMGSLKYGDDFRTMKIERKRQQLYTTIRRLKRNRYNP